MTTYFLKWIFDLDGEVVLFTSENKNIEFHEVFKTITKWEENFYVPEYSRFSIRLRANKDIPLRMIKQFEFQLLVYNHFEVIYEVENDDESTANFYNHQIGDGISTSLSEYFEAYGSPPKPLGWEWNKKQTYTDTVLIHISDKILINETEINFHNLSEEFKKYIKSSIIFEFIYNDALTYQDFINVLSEYKKAVYELREIENFSAIDKEYRKNQFYRDEKLKKERRRIMDKYPINITERFE